MFDLLPPSDYAKVETFFRPLQHLLFCKAILHGTMAGQVYVDDLDQPRSAFALTRDIWGYLAGEARNAAFNQALGQALFERQVISPEAFGLIFAIASEDWKAHFPLIFGKFEPIPGRRLHYTARTPVNQARPAQTGLPAGYEMHPIDAGLMRRRDLDLPEDVRRLGQSLQDKPQDVQNGFGYVVLHQGKAGPAWAAHAVVDCVVDGEGDIGLETAEAHRRKGLAAAVSAAAIDYGLSNGLRTVVWDCAANNLPSVRTAQRLGLGLDGEHWLYFVDYEYPWHQVGLAGACRDEGDYARACSICQQVLLDEANPPEATHYMLACAQAGLGELDAALDSLEEARRRGWYNPDALRGRAEFAPLHGLPRWEGLLHPEPAG